MGAETVEQYRVLVPPLPLGTVELRIILLQVLMMVTAAGFTVVTRIPSSQTVKSSIMIMVAGSIVFSHHQRSLAVNSWPTIPA